MKWSILHWILSNVKIHFLKENLFFFFWNLGIDFRFNKNVVCCFDFRALHLLSSGLNLAIKQITDGSLKPSDNVKNGELIVYTIKTASNWSRTHKMTWAVLAIVCFSFHSNHVNELKIQNDLDGIKKIERIWLIAKSECEQHYCWQNSLWICYSNGEFSTKSHQQFTIFNWNCSIIKSLNTCFLLYQCQSAALDELFGKPGVCFPRYQTAQILFHSLSQHTDHPQDKTILGKCNVIEFTKFKCDSSSAIGWIILTELVELFFCFLFFLV